MGLRPDGLALAPSIGRAYVANGYSSAVSVIDLNAGRVTADIPIGGVPEDVAVFPVPR